MSLCREIALIAVGLAAVATVACSDDTSPGRGRVNDPNHSTGGGSPLGVAGNTGGPIGIPMVDPNVPMPGELPKPTCTEDCTDFPADPILEGNVPATAPTLFGAPDTFASSGAPCVLEPQLSSGSTPGALFPANWLRPRFRFTAAGDLFEIRISSEVQRNDLVAYTKTALWAMPKDIWEKAAVNNIGKPMTVTIRAVQSGSPGMPSGVRGDILIAPVNAGGSMVFWTVSSSEVGPESSKLMGFSVGEEGVAQTLTPKTVQFKGVIHEEGRDLRGTYGGGKPGFQPGDVQCVGCHTSTPDGDAVIFTDDWPWNKAASSVDPKQNPGSIPSYISPGARALMKMPWLGTQTMSKGHWSAGDRLLITGFGARGLPFSGYANGDRIAWIDLETTAAISDEVPLDEANDAKGVAQRNRNQAIQAAQGSAWGVFALDGEVAHAVTPDISNAGDKIAYVSTDLSPNGHPSYDANRADIYTVPFNARKGGAVTPLSGAADSQAYEYYPSFSADDALIAFTRAPNKGSCPKCPDGPYYNRFGEINVIPAAGGTRTPLLANKPVQCAGDNADIGLINSWPKWSPSALKVDGKTYYFLIFSSARKYDGQFAIPRSPNTPSTLDDGNAAGVRSSQLYMAGVVVDEAGTVTSYPAVYLWNQNRVVVAQTATTIQSSALTPAWDEFKIPPVTITIE
jgi:hypothetical protein